MSDKINIHFNKAHNADSSIPAWVVQTKGETHYVNHVTITPGLGFSTKERPDHPSTKACLVVRGVLMIDDSGEAVIN
jgi:hypothetical protein